MAFFSSVHSERIFWPLHRHNNNNEFYFTNKSGWSGAGALGFSASLCSNWDGWAGPRCRPSIPLVNESSNKVLMAINVQTRRFGHIWVGSAGCRSPSWFAATEMDTHTVRIYCRLLYIRIVSISAILAGRPFTAQKREITVINTQV